MSLKLSDQTRCLLLQVKDFKGSDGKTGAAGLAGDAKTSYAGYQADAKVGTPLGIWDDAEAVGLPTEFLGSFLGFAVALQDEPVAIEREFQVHFPCNTSADALDVCRMARWTGLPRARMLPRHMARASRFAVTNKSSAL